MSSFKYKYVWWRRLLKSMVRERKLTPIERMSSRIGYMGSGFLMAGQWTLEPILFIDKWEVSRNGDLFPHYYGNLETKFAEKTYNLHLNADGIHEFPENFFS